MPTPGKPKTSRRRRTADQAQREILDAAERRLRDAGPDSIRLQDVARDVGVSHPAILHHFGSREGLVEAVVRRAFDSLQAELVRELGAPEIGAERTAALLDRVFRVLGDRGYARLLAWLLLSAREPKPPGMELSAVAKAAHAHRSEQHGAAPYEDTLFSILLAALALFADAIAGDAMRASAGLGDDAEAGKRFRDWLAELLVEHVESRAS